MFLKIIHFTQKESNYSISRNIFPPLAPFLPLNLHDFCRTCPKCLTDVLTVFGKKLLLTYLSASDFLFNVFVNLLRF